MHAAPGAKAHMEVDEFDMFCNASGLLNDSFASREVSLLFNLSMFTQVDELEKARHLRATPLEFMEMFVRCCDEASLPPPAFEDSDGEEIASTMPLE